MPFINDLPTLHPGGLSGHRDSSVFLWFSLLRESEIYMP